MSGSGAETGAMDLQAVVGAGRGGCGGDADSGSVGGKDGGGGGDGQDSNVYGQIIRWDYTVANVILGTEPNATLAYAPGLEPHQLIMSKIGGHGGRLEREIYIRIPTFQYNKVSSK